MANTPNIIKIKRSSTANKPSSLYSGELAYSYGTTPGSSPQRLFIGSGDNGFGVATSIDTIGGLYYTNLIDQSTAGTLTTSASSIPILSATGTINDWRVGNLELTSNTLSSTNSNGNIVLTPNGSGYVTISGTNALVIPSGSTGQQAPALSGAIRYNTTTSQFEGYVGASGSGTWSSLGGVRSVDGKAYILAETTPGAGNDTLQFYASSTGLSTGTSTKYLDINGLGFAIGAVDFSINGNKFTVASSSGNTVIGGTLQIASDLTTSNSTQNVFNSTATTVNAFGAGTTISIGASTGTTTINNNLVVTGTLTVPNIVDGYATTATAAGTTTLTATSKYQQYFTGTTTQTVVLPVVSTLVLGQQYQIVNNSTGNVTVQSSGANTIFAMPSGTVANYTVIAVTGTGTSSWNADYVGFSSITGTGANVLATAPTFVTSIDGSATFSAFASSTALTLAGASSTTYFGTNSSNNIVSILGNGTSGTATLTSNVTTGTVNLFNGVTTGTVNFAGGGAGTINIGGTGSTTVVKHLTVEGVTSSGATGTTNIVFSNSPTLVTPVLGVASATSLATSAGLVSTGLYTGSYTDGIILDYDSGNSNARISAGSGDGFTFYNAADTTRVQLLSISSAGVVTLTGSIVGTATQAVFNTVSTNVSAFGAATSISIGASTGTLTISNPTITGTNATALNLNGASPSIATTSTGTASVFNTNALTGNLFGAATSVNIGGTATTAVAVGTNSSAAVTATLGGAVTGNTLKLASTTSGTVNLTTDVTTGIVNLVAGVSTGTVNLATGGASTVNIGGTGSTTVVKHLTVEGVTSSGATGTGNIVFSASPTFTGTVGSAGISMTGNIAMGSNYITGLHDPLNAQDAATKAYVDAAATSINVHDSVEVLADATNTAITGATYSAGSADANGGTGIGATLTDATSGTVLAIDTYNLVLNDRVLINSFTSTNSYKNGVYYLSQVGVSGTTKWILTRATDYDNHIAGQVIAGDFAFVVKGSTYKDTGWIQIAVGSGTAPADAIKIGTDAINYTQFSGAGTYTAGAGLTLTGTVFSVHTGYGLDTSGSGNSLELSSSVAGSGLNYSAGVLSIGGTSNRITINTNSVDIASTYVGQSSITTLGTITSGTWNANTVAAQYGGTGVASYNKGDILYAGSTSSTLASLTALSAGTDGMIIQQQSGVPTWGYIDGGTY